jgi:hypothetical protein
MSSQAAATAINSIPNLLPITDKVGPNTPVILYYSGFHSDVWRIWGRNARPPGEVVIDAIQLLGNCSNHFFTV